MARRRSTRNQGPLERAGTWTVENWQTVAVIAILVFAFFTIKKYAGGLFGAWGAKWDANREGATRKVKLPNTPENQQIAGATQVGDSVEVEIPNAENLAASLAVALDYPGYWLRKVSRAQVEQIAKELYRSQYVPFRIYFDAWAKNNPEFEKEGIYNPRLEDAFSRAVDAIDYRWDGADPKQSFISNMKDG